MLKRPFVIVQPEQQRPHEPVFSRLVPAKARDNTIGGARVLDLDHRALARLVHSVRRLDDDTIETGALKAREPIRRDRMIGRHRCEIDRRLDVSQEPLEAYAPLVLRLGAQVSPVDSNEIERHERRRRLPRQLRHARRRGVKAQLERIEIETVGCRDHDLTIDNAVIWQCCEKGGMQIRKVAIERARVAALDEHIGAAAKDDRAEAVPFGFVEQSIAGWQRVSELGEHRLDRR